MATGHSILDALNTTSKGGQPIGPSGKFRTKDLPIDQLYRNEGNFYAITEIEELAGMILATGLLENLAVVYDPTDAGQYRIVSGERRWEALKLLVSQGHTDFTVATCNVRAKRSQEEETIDLIAANSQRVKSIEDQLQEYTTLKATLETMRANGQKLDGYDLESGRLRTVIAEILHKSTTKIAQIERISTHLIPELRELLGAGRLKFSAGYKLAGLDEDEQRAVFQRGQDEEREITHQEIVQEIKKNDRNPYAAGDCELVHGACDHWPVIKANFMHDGGLTGCAGCCARCNKRNTCDFCCSVVADQRPAPVVEANPQTLTSLCYGCQNWETCMDRTDKTTTCPQYRSKNAKQQPEQEAPVEAYREEDPTALLPDPDEKFTDDELDPEVVVDLIRGCIEGAGMHEQLTGEALKLLEEMWKAWKNWPRATAELPRVCGRSDGHDDHGNTCGD